jgi:hypothetical protein
MESQSCNTCGMVQTGNRAWATTLHLGNKTVRTCQSCYNKSPGSGPSISVSCNVPPPASAFSSTEYASYNIPGATIYVPRDDKNAIPVATGHDIVDVPLNRPSRLTPPMKSGGSVVKHSTTGMMFGRLPGVKCSKCQQERPDCLLWYGVVKHNQTVISAVCDKCGQM